MTLLVVGTVFLVAVASSVYQFYIAPCPDYQISFIQQIVEKQAIGALQEKLPGVRAHLRTASAIGIAAKKLAQPAQALMRPNQSGRFNGGRRSTRSEERVR